METTRAKLCQLRKRFALPTVLLDELRRIQTLFSKTFESTTEEELHPIREHLLMLESVLLEKKDELRELKTKIQEKENELLRLRQSVEDRLERCLSFA